MSNNESENGETWTGLYSHLPLVQVLSPVGVEGDVVLHCLVPEEEVLVPPLAGGGGRRQDEVSDVSLCSSELYWSVESVYLVESSPRGKGHQIRVDALYKLVREPQSGRGDEVEREGEDGRRTLLTALREPEL